MSVGANPLPIAALPNAWYNDHPIGSPYRDRGEATMVFPWLALMARLDVDNPETFDADEAARRAVDCLEEGIGDEDLTPCYACGKVSSPQRLQVGQREVRHCPRCLRMTCAECWDLPGYYQDGHRANARCCFPSE